MDPRPVGSLLLLAGLLLHSRRCQGAPSLYTIDAVVLRLLPGPTAPSGASVTLSCSVRVSHDSSRRLAHLFRFTRDDAVVCTANTTEAEARCALDPARAADSGEYECQVEVLEKVRSSRRQRLTVTGLQTPVLQLSSGEIYEGEGLEASCSAPQEKGALVFLFFQRPAGGPVEFIKRVISAGNRSDTRLVLRETGDREMFCNYSIPMAPQAGSSNSSNTLRVLVKGLFISPIMNVLPSSSVFEGDVVEVVCKVVSSPGPVDVYLTKDHKVLKQGTNVLSHRLIVWTADAGEYVCKGEYGATQKESYQSIRVREMYSRPQLTLEPHEVFEGEIMRVSCVIDSYSPERITIENMQYSIFKNDELLNRDQTYSAAAQASQNGNYTCKAQADSQGTTLVKESATLVVKAKVPVSEPVLSVVGGRLLVGKPFALRCHSDSGSLPITYTLHGPRRPVQTRVVRWAGEQAVFNTSAVPKSSDLLDFLCMAQNNELSAAKRSGQEILHSTEIIEPVSRPVLTLVPNGAFVSEGQDLTLLCSVQKGTHPVTFTWFHSDRPAPLAFQSVRGARGSYTIPGVAPAHSGGYYCESSNPAGEVKRSFTVVVGVRMAGWKKGVIAVVCVLVLMAVVLAVLHKKGLLRRRRSRQLSVKAASTRTERLSLTKAVESDAVNVTPGVMGRNVWSEHVSGSDTDERNSVASPEESEPQYTEVRTRQPDPSRGPVRRGTDTVYSEVRNSKQGVSEEPADGGSVEYAQLNHDSGRNSGHRNSHHSNSGLHNGDSVQPDSVDDIDELNNTESATEHEDCRQDDPSPDC